MNGTLPGSPCRAARTANLFYGVTNILIAKPALEESTDPFIPFLVTAGAIRFTVVAMLIQLLSEFDVALGRPTSGGE
jgi:hypothetical protein